MDGYRFREKTVFVRPDLNCPVDEKTLAVEKSERLPAHAKTIRELAKKKAKVVVLAHQGRKGDYDCISLSQHALFLGDEVKLPVKFVDDVCGEKAKAAIKSLQGGEILLLENVRFLDDETKYKTIEENANATLAKELSPFCDVFVLDGFSVSHRAQASVVGFYQKPVVAGRVMQRELEALSKLGTPEHPAVFIFGGAKPEDSIGIMENWLSSGKIDAALTCGVLGELLLLASGRQLGKTEEFLREKKATDQLPKAKELLEKYKEKILLPLDVAVDADGARKDVASSRLPSDFPIMDIGKRTTKKYKGLLSGAKTVLVNGPAGVYENPNFEYGTKKLLKSIEKSGAFSVFGGGHTLSALDKFKIRKKKLGYVSLAGKALIEYLSGEELPGVKILG
jgi:phosphoglycerate kinase